MSARILDGTATARAIREELRGEVEALARRGVRPGLGVVLVGDDPASAVYVGSKTRACERAGHAQRDPPAGRDRRPRTRSPPSSRSTTGGPTSTASSCSCRCPRRWTRRASSTWWTRRRTWTGSTPTTSAGSCRSAPRFVPCTPAGIMELLARHGIPVAGRRAVVIGRSDIVGKPMALLLMHADATVTVCHSRTRRPAGGDAARRTSSWPRSGRAGFVRAEHVKPGAVVIDVGMNRVEDPRAGAGPARPGAPRGIREEGPRARGRRARPVGARGGVGRSRPCRGASAR